MISLVFFSLEGTSSELRRPHGPLHASPSLADVFFNLSLSVLCHCEPCKGEAICLSLAMERSDRSNLIASRSLHCVRNDTSLYARNDKNPRCPRGLKPLAMTTLSMLAITISSAWARRAPCLGRGNAGRLLTQGSGS